jgi:hypothetical protein
MQFRHVRVLFYKPLDATRSVTVNGLHGPVATLSDPVDSRGGVAAMAVTSAVQK